MCSKDTSLAMSDCPRDLELELHKVVIAVNDVAGEQWYDLGLQLRLPTSVLDSITSHPVDVRKRMMLGKWLQYDPEASWEKLACALTLVGHKTTATNVRSQFVRIVTTAGEDRKKDEDKIGIKICYTLNWSPTTVHSTIHSRPGPSMALVL